MFKEQNASLLNLRNSYESEYESIPLRARAPVTSSTLKKTSPAANIYHRNTNIDHDDLYNQNQYYHVTSIVDIHSKNSQQQKSDQMAASNYSLSSVIFNSDHHHHNQRHQRESSLTCLNNNASTSSSTASSGNSEGTMRNVASPIYRVNNYENNNSSNSSTRATTPIASITPLSGTSNFGGYQTPLQSLYAQKYNNNKYFQSNR